MSDTSARRRLFFIIFTASGFSGLIYESIWSHYLKLFLGHAAYAQTLVLAIFMGGMALGSWLMARYSHRISNLLLGYAIVEGVIGLMGLIFHSTSTGVTGWVFNSVLPNLESVGAAQFIKWSIGALLILPQSILLGMTFPLMSGATVRRFPDQSGDTLAMLYFTNSLGAALGVLVSGFVLIDAVGLPGTIMTAGLMNIALALFVWGVVKYRPDSVRPALPTPPPSAEASQPSGLLRWILIGAAVTGAASFLYEIAWIRMLSLVLGSSTHSFEMMLSAFILGIALGGLWVHRRIDSMKNPIRFLSIILMIMAVVALLSLPLYNYTFNLMAGVISTFSPTEQGYVGFNLASSAIAILMMIPTTFFCGMTLPIMTQVLIRGGVGERAIGTVYAWNTAGAIAGTLLAVHVLMTVVGVKGVVIIGAALQLVLATIYWHRSSSSGERVRFSPAPIALGAAAIAGAVFFVQLDAAKLTSGVFRHGRAAHDANTTVRFLKHGKTASISLVEMGDTVVIATNGKPDAAINMKSDRASTDEITMVVAGALPMALHPNPREVASIGFGSGLTSHVLLASPTIQTVDTIEIEPMIPQAAKLGFMPHVSRVFEDPRSHIYIEDAKTFFALHRKKYDVIVSEPSNPWVSGVATLFSEEFYKQITKHLQPDGMLVQWIQIYEVDLDIVLSIVKALAPEFEDFAIYNADRTNILIVASRGGKVRPLDAALFSNPTMNKELTRVGLRSIQDIESRFLGNKELLLPLLRHSGVPANSDYFPYVDLNAPRTRILRRNALEFSDMQLLSVPFFELVADARHPRASTLPMLTPNTPRDQMTAGAVAIREAITTKQYDNVDPSMTRLMLTLFSSAEACSSPAVQKAWLDSAFVVAAETSTPLSAAELHGMWKIIDGTPCAGLLDDQGRQMLGLLRSVAARDVGEVVRLGTALLEGDHSFTTSQQLSFALIATSASAVGAGEPQKALGLIAKNMERVPGATSDSLALRWLASIASDHAEPGEKYANDNSRH
jgi:spermidine synthase